MNKPCPEPKELRAWANHPASSGTVPVYPTTLEAIADEVERLTADGDALRNLITQFDAAIRRIAAELTVEACCGVDTGDEINPATGEPYGHGGHTGWLLAEEAKKLKSKNTHAYARMAVVMRTVEWAIQSANLHPDIKIKLEQAIANIPAKSEKRESCI